MKNPVYYRPVGQYGQDPQDRIHSEKGPDDEKDDPLGTLQEAGYDASVL